jgi:hypothetical protein
MIEDINKKLKDNVEDSSLAAVAKTGSYKDLAYKPVIPSVPRKISSFQNDLEYLTQEDIAGKADKANTYTKPEVDSLIAEAARSADLADVATSGSYNDLIDTPVRDYIPVRKNGVGYLYDKVSGNLFGNVALNSAFTYGNDV